MNRQDRVVQPAAVTRFHLARLEHFVRLAAALDAAGADAEQRRWRRLAHHAAFSAYRDCAALGLADAARRVLDRCLRHHRQAA